MGTVQIDRIDYIIWAAAVVDYDELDDDQWRQNDHDAER